MKFGRSTAEAEAEPKGGGAGGFIKYMKDGDNQIQIVDEYDNWTWYWEHYNPGGYPFPCTRERTTCPGCISEVEKMKKASYRAAFNAYDGEYTNVWKVPQTVADKLKNRSERLGTITDRPYLITRTKNDKGFYDYDIEGQLVSKLDMKEISQYVRDPEVLLAEAYEEAWGDSAKAQATTQKSEQATKEADLQERVNQAVAEKEAAQPEKPPFETSSEANVVSEADLRKMDPMALLEMCQEEGLGDPDGCKTADEIVDYMLTKV